MVDLEKSYNNLKKIAIDQYASNHEFLRVDINVLKDLYAGIIDSPRMFDQIKDVAFLIRILEKRGELSLVKIGALEFIYTALKLSFDLFNEHISLVKRQNYFADLYDDESVPLNPTYESSHGQLGSVTSHETFTTPQGVLSDQVIRTVCSQIGSSWKTLARYLGKIVDTIDEIEENRVITSNEERARIILYEFQKNAVLSEVKSKLLNALQLSGRMDIHNQVQDLFIS